MPFTHSDYTVAVICPMGVELAPVEAMLDEIHDNLPAAGRSKNAYTLGTIGSHNVVVAIMPETGNNIAAVVATQLLYDFPAVAFGLLVGVGGGAPAAVDVRLGDIVISQPTKSFGGVVQYDLGKRLVNGQFERTGQLNEPPWILTSHVRKLESQHRRVGSRSWEILSQMFERYPRMQAEYSFPETELDILFRSAYQHQQGDTCDSCDRAEVIPRQTRPSREPRVFYGIIGSANAVIRDAQVRDQLSKDMGVVCVDMEAAGLMNSFPCLVIRGICDYADSHKNKQWQPYAAAVAAAYMKELLMILPSEQVLAKAVTETRFSEVSLKPVFDTGIHLEKAPILDSSLFVGRTKEIERMATELRRHSPTQRRIVLWGMGGVGKTQLAIAFAKKQRGLFDSIFWLDATSEATLGTSFRTIGQWIDSGIKVDQLTNQQVRSAVLKWLCSSNNKRWLLIFDGYDQPETFDIKRYCPATHQGSIIITTRLSDGFSGRIILLSPFDNVDDSLAVLACRSGRVDAIHNFYAHKLVKRLGGLPLALATVGAYLRTSPWTFKQYHEEYDQKWNLDNQRPVQLEEYPNRTLYTTWNTSYIQLKQSDPDAAHFLQLLTYFGNQGLCSNLFTGLGRETRSWPFSIGATTSGFDNLMRSLSRYCFVVEAELYSISYNIPPCIHDWMLSGLNTLADSNKTSDPEFIDMELHSLAFRCITGCITRCIPDDPQVLERWNLAWLVPHALRIVCTKFIANGCWWGIWEVETRIATKSLARLLHRKNMNTGEVLAILEKVLTEYEDWPSVRDAHSIEILILLVYKYECLSKYENAYRLALRALSDAQSRLGPHHNITLCALLSCGNVCISQKKWDEAEKYLAQALGRARNAFGPNDAISIRAQACWDALQYDQDRYFDANLPLHS